MRQCMLRYQIGLNLDRILSHRGDDYLGTNGYSKKWYFFPCYEEQIRNAYTTIWFTEQLSWKFNDMNIRLYSYIYIIYIHKWFKICGYIVYVKRLIRRDYHIYFLAYSRKTQDFDMVTKWHRRLHHDSAKMATTAIFPLTSLSGGPVSVLGISTCQIFVHIYMGKMVTCTNRYNGNPLSKLHLK